MKLNTELIKVRLKDGKEMNYSKSEDKRHVFLGDVITMNIWMIALLIFIVLTSILIGFYQIMTYNEIGTMMMNKLVEIQSSLTQGSLLYTDNGVISLLQP